MTRPIYYIELLMAEKKKVGGKEKLMPLNRIIKCISKTYDIDSVQLLKKAIISYLNKNPYDLKDLMKEFKIIEILNYKQIGETIPENNDD